MEFLSEDQNSQYRRLSPAGKLKFLKELLQDAHGSAEICIRKVIFDLEEEEKTFNEMDFRSTYEPESFDVIVSDIKEDDLLSIGNELGIARLSKLLNAGPTAYPLMGIIYGPTRKVFLPLVVSLRGVHINVLFLVDTGSPNTYLREDTMQALGHVESMPTKSSVQINGFRTTAYLSRAHFDNVDLLGQDWLTVFNAMLVIKYASGSVELHQEVVSA